MAGGDVILNTKSQSDYQINCSDRHFESQLYVESYHDKPVSPHHYHLDLSHRTVDEFRSPSATEIRCINSAIFIERFDSENDSDFWEHSDRTYRKNEVNSQSDLTRRLKSDYNKKPRGMSFEDWLQSKQKLKAKVVNPQPVVEDKKKSLEEQRDDFKRWLTLKREQEQRAKKKQVEINLLKAKQEEELRIQKDAEKEAIMSEWKKKKLEELKEKKRKELEKLRQMEEEKKARREQSARAFEQWMEKSKSNPRPVPLNMGVDSLRGSVSAMFINPTPWQENIDLQQS